MVNSIELKARIVINDSIDQVKKSLPHSVNFYTNYAIGVIAAYEAIGIINTDQAENLRKQVYDELVNK